MASPTVTMDDLRTLHAWQERLLKRGLNVADVQPSIDNRDLLDRLIAYMRAGYPDLVSSSAPLTLASLAESESHERARTILGSEFVGLDIARCVYKHLLTDEHVTALNDICLFDEKRDAFKTIDDTMDILRMIAKGERKRFLFPLLPVSVPELRAVCPYRFYNDPTPWFYEQRQRDKWSDKRPARACWCLMDAELFPRSLGQNVEAQDILTPATCPGYRLSLPWEYVPGALLYQTATNRMIGGSKWVRFFVRTADGDWVFAYWFGGRLDVSYLHGGACVNVGSCALRASSES